MLNITRQNINKHFGLFITAIFKHTHKLVASIIAYKTVVLSSLTQNLSKLSKQSIACCSSYLTVYCLQNIKADKYKGKVIRQRFFFILIYQHITLCTIRQLSLSVHIHKIFNKVLHTTEQNSAETAAN